MPTIGRQTRAFARGLKLAKDRGNLSVIGISKKSGCTEWQISKIMKQEKGLTLDTACRISEAVGISIDTLILMGDTHVHQSTDPQ